MNRKLSSVIIILCFLFATSSVAFAKKGDRDKDKDSDKGKKGLRHKVDSLEQQIIDLQQKLADIQLTPGPQGPAGPPGADGTNGTNGVNGIDGVDGADGATGPQGPQGDTGPQGLAGIDGTNGTNGTNGIDGVNGADGAVGATGPTGPQGPAGTPKVHYVQGTGGNIATDNGFIAGRELTFVKESNTSNLMVIYSDNFRVYTPNRTWAQGRWHVYLDGVPTNIVEDLHSDSISSRGIISNNIHRRGTLVGFLENIPSGSHTIKIAAVPLSSPPDDMHTGWNLSSFSLVVQELD